MDEDTGVRYNKPRKTRRLCIISLVVLAAVVLAIVIVLAVTLTKDDDSDSHPQPGNFDPAGSPLDFFDTDDALNITWYHGANSKAQLEEALEGDYMMLEGDITLRWYGYPNQTDEPIMAHPPDVDSDNTLDNWLDEIITRDDKGMKLDFKSDDVIEPSLELVKSKGAHINCPVWANADVVKGPGSQKDPLDADEFLERVNRLFPSMTLSLGWTTECCDELYTRPMMEDMWEVALKTEQPISYPARAALFKSSWLEFKWLLEKDPERFSITVWTPSGADNWEGATPFDLLYCRNDCHKKNIYYDLPGPLFDEFRQLSITAGTPLNHFPNMEDRDAMKITWAHAVNSRQELDEALEDDIMMLEADVMLRYQGTANQTDEPIMAHPPDIDSDINLDQWLDGVIASPKAKGIKLDFKYIQAVEPSMKILTQKKANLTMPVWINADIFLGPGSDPTMTPVNATEFKRIVQEHFPECTLSIGWKTAWYNRPDDEVYTQEHIDEMLEYAQTLEQPVTYPIRAAMLGGSWDVLKYLLDQSRAYTLTVWSSKSDDVDPDDLVRVRLDSEIDRIYYDLPDELMQEFLDRLNMTQAESGVPSHGNSTDQSA